MTKPYTHPRTLAMQWSGVEVLLAGSAAPASSTETITIGGGGNAGSGR